MYFAIAVLFLPTLEELESSNLAQCGQPFFVFHWKLLSIYCYYYNFFHRKYEITPRNGIKKERTFILVLS